MGEFFNQAFYKQQRERQQEKGLFASVDDFNKWEKPFDSIGKATEALEALEAVKNLQDFLRMQKEVLPMAEMLYERDAGIAVAYIEGLSGEELQKVTDDFFKKLLTHKDRDVRMAAFKLARKRIKFKEKLKDRAR